MKTSIFRAVIVPAVVTAGCLWMGINMDYVQYFGVISLVLGFIYQGIEGLVNYSIMEGDTESKLNLIEKMQRDIEMASLKLNIWMSMAGLAITLFVASLGVMVLFFSVCVVYSIFRYLNHSARYNDDLEKIHREMR